jgi:hypothetical protein
LLYQSCKNIDCKPARIAESCHSVITGGEREEEEREEGEREGKRKGEIEEEEGRGESSIVAVLA